MCMFTFSFLLFLILLILHSEKPHMIAKFWMRHTKRTDIFKG